MPSSSIQWPSHIEHYNLELAMQTDFDSIEFEDDSIDDRSKTSSLQPEQFVATKKRGFGESTTTATTTTAIEHFNPIDPSKPSANEAAPITTLKQETKRRKSNCSNKPQKIHNHANTKHGGNKTNRKIREVQVYSSDGGVMLHSFPNCAEAGRKMHVGKSRINHVCRQGGGVINGMLYKYADVAEALPALPLSHAFGSSSMDIDD